MTILQGLRLWRSYRTGRPHNVRPARVGGRTRLLLLALAGLTVAAVAWAGAVPAASADEHGSMDVPAGCELVTGNLEYSRGLNFFTGSHPYIQCEEVPDGRDCVDVDMQSYHQRHGTQHDMTPAEFRAGDHFCAADSSAEFLECQDDIRFSWSGPFNADSEQRWLAQDRKGYILVTDDDPDWWVNEIVAEHALAEEGDYEGGQSCQVGFSRPDPFTCEQINERKDELDAQLSDALAELEDVDHVDDIARGQEADLDLDTGDELALAELRELEADGGIVPDGCWGRYPSDRYQISWNIDNERDDSGNAARLMGWTATVFFEVAKAAMGVALWLVHLGFSFDVNSYRGDVGAFAEHIDVSFVHFGGGRDITLLTMAWFVLFAYAGFNLLKGRVGVAFGELLVAVLAAGVGVVLLGDFFPSGDGGHTQTVAPDEAAYAEGSYFDTVGNLLNASSLAMLRVANGDDPDMSPRDMGGAEVRQTIAETNSQLHQEFVERPYHFINYGRESFNDDVTHSGDPDEELLDDDVAYQFLSCQEVVDHVTTANAEGPWVQRFMERNGCQDMAEHNGAMTVERLMDATAVVVAAVIVAVMLGLASVTLLVAKFLVALVFVALPVAVVLALLPGRGRSLAFGWFTSMVQLWLVALGMGLILALTLMSMSAIHYVTEDRSPAERWLMILLPVVALYLLRKRLVASAQRFANGLQDQLTTGLSGAKNAGSGAAGGGRFNDMDLGTVDRAGAASARVGKAAALTGGGLALAGAAMAARGAAKPVGAARRMAVTEYGRRRLTKLDHAGQWRNTMAGQQLAEAQDVALGAKSSRGEVLESQVGAAAVGRQKGRQIDAAAAIKDFETVENLAPFQGTKHGGRRAWRKLSRQSGAPPPKGRLNPDQQKALGRLGVDYTTEWLGAGSTKERRDLITRARRHKDHAVERAGGPVAPSREDHANAAAQIARANTGVSQERYYDRNDRRENDDRNDPKVPKRANGRLAPDEVAGRARYLYESRVQSKEEAEEFVKRYPHFTSPRGRWSGR